MIDGSFKGFTPPPHSSPFTQGEFDFSSKPSRSPVVLETFHLPVQLIEIKKACDDYSKKGFLARFFGAPSIIKKIVEFNNQLNDRILTLNRNTIKIHGSLEDLATDLESLQKEVTEKKKGSETSTSSDSQYMDRITSLEAEQRQLKLMLSNVSSSTGGSNLIFWSIGIIILNILVTYGIVNSLN